MYEWLLHHHIIKSSAKGGERMNILWGIVGRIRLRQKRLDELPVDAV
jgi:hypothetical protein